MLLDAMGCGLSSTDRNGDLSPTGLESEEDRVSILAKKLWDYMILGQELVKSDVILVLGCHDTRVAEYAARLWLDGWAEYLLFSGNLGHFTKGVWDRPEAEIFHDIAVSLGVPDDRILRETLATNTGENIKFSHQVLRQHKVKANSVILVQMPYMERRTYATFVKQWPGDKENTHVVVTSPRIAFQDYPSDDVGGLKTTVNNLVGVLERIKSYPSRGFQIHQDIPDDVWLAYEELVDMGYDGLDYKMKPC
ncbi:PREDICTED: uncharacterized protein LOC109466849 [Branchiostoma belcheri]|uniref:Uncharacterized protein LOC109466849 n=1 Tax=Branchiostoma belcheri TaxID=7741 RepID=A0A6P4YNJ1_BRABE|nr:PREDICTED: uncharacterized protein LOC109466849 [Branchiostoma belcheri]